MITASDRRGHTARSQSNSAEVSTISSHGHNAVGQARNEGGPVAGTHFVKPIRASPPAPTIFLPTIHGLTTVTI